MQAPQSTQPAAGRGSLGSEDLGVVAAGAGGVEGWAAAAAGAAETVWTQGWRQGEAGYYAAPDQQILAPRSELRPPPATCTDSGTSAASTHHTSEFLKHTCRRNGSVDHAAPPPAPLYPRCSSPLQSTASSHSGSGSSEQLCWSALRKSAERATMLERPQNQRRRCEGRRAGMTGKVGGGTSGSEAEGEG